MKKKIKIYLILGSIFLSGLAVSYGAGTFQPNKWTVKSIVENVKFTMREEWKSLGLKEPSVEYDSNVEFVTSVDRCIQWVNFNLDPDQRIPREIILSMAVLETGYGKSRFANEGNNLFGIRTWDDTIPQLKPLGNPDVKWGVRAYKTKCDSVKHMISTINNHHAYELFREERSNQLKSNSIDINKQIELLKKWSTNPIYTDLIKQKVLSIRKVLENA